MTSSHNESQSDMTFAEWLRGYTSHQLTGEQEHRNATFIPRGPIYFAGGAALQDWIDDCRRRGFDFHGLPIFGRPLAEGDDMPMGGGGWDAILVDCQRDSYASTTEPVTRVYVYAVRQGEIPQGGIILRAGDRVRSGIILG